MLDDFAYKLNEWFGYYDEQCIEIPNVLQLTDFYNKIVLEIGCATGKSTLQTFERTKIYFGIDCDIRVINFCKEKYQKNNLFFLLNNAEDLLFKSEYFDIVYLPWIFNYIKNKDKAVNEIFRVLKPGGKLILVDSSSECDYNNILSGIIDDVQLDPKKAYEIPLSKKFKIIKKLGPIAVPYNFISVEKAEELLRFIIEEYLEIKLVDEKLKLLRNNISQYIQKDNKIVFYEKPLYYLFEKNSK